MINSSIPAKKILPMLKVLGCAAAFAVLPLSQAAYQSQIRATVDDLAVTFPDVQPMMVRGRVMVPVRGIFEHMNAQVEWDDQTQMVTATRGLDTVKLPLNSRIGMVNGMQVTLDSPAMLRYGRAMVPLRFISEAMKASVDWNAYTRTVEVRTGIASQTPPLQADYTYARLNAGTVIPFSTLQKLTSNESRAGDTFKASLETNGDRDYQGIPNGSILEGHVEVARAKIGDEPGVLGLAFDRIRMPNGTSTPIEGALIGLDSKSVSTENGRITAKAAGKKDSLKYVGYGAGAGVLVSLLTKSNLLTSTLIGSALGLLFGEIQKDPSKSRDVTLDTGSKFGVRLTENSAFKVPIELSAKKN